MSTALPRVALPLLLVWATLGCHPHGSQGPAPEPGTVTAFEVNNPTLCTAVVWRPDSPTGTIPLGTVPAAARRTFVVPAGTSVFADLDRSSGSACDDLARRRLEIRQISPTPNGG